MKLGIVIADKGHPTELEQIISATRKVFGEGSSADIESLIVKVYNVIIYLYVETDRLTFA